MGWKDDFGRDEIVMHPSLISGAADWRIEAVEPEHGRQVRGAAKYPAADEPADPASKERIEQHSERLAPILERKRRERANGQSDTPQVKGNPDA